MLFQGFSTYWVFRASSTVSDHAGVRVRIRVYAATRVRVRVRIRVYAATRVRVRIRVYA